MSRVRDFHINSVVPRPLRDAGQRQAGVVGLDVLRHPGSGWPGLLRRDAVEAIGGVSTMAIELKAADGGTV
ncbi:hypothetical protein, partial [Accumulibacter sp.]|uniref:hypothetical protein n=1 Tax=Accumulibacter sp. TaxID=2053492 RepID=UPI0028C38CA2